MAFPLCRSSRVHDRAKLVRLPASFGAPTPKFLVCKLYFFSLQNPFFVNPKHFRRIFWELKKSVIAVLYDLVSDRYHRRDSYKRMTFSYTRMIEQLFCAKGHKEIRPKFGTEPCFGVHYQ